MRCCTRWGGYSDGPELIGHCRIPLPVTRTTPPAVVITVDAHEDGVVLLTVVDDQGRKIGPVRATGTELPNPIHPPVLASSRPGPPPGTVPSTLMRTNRGWKGTDPRPTNVGDIDLQRLMTSNRDAVDEVSATGMGMAAEAGFGQLVAQSRYQRTRLRPGAPRQAWIGLFAEGVVFTNVLRDDLLLRWQDVLHVTYLRTDVYQQAGAYSSRYDFVRHRHALTVQPRDHRTIKIDQGMTGTPNVGLVAARLHTAAVASGLLADVRAGRPVPVLTPQPLKPGSSKPMKVEANLTGLVCGGSLTPWTEIGHIAGDDDATANDGKVEVITTDGIPLLWFAMGPGAHSLQQATCTFLAHLIEQADR